ncbi:cytochrome c [Novacetimonas hansenii]|uniref:c-type cytochrome n=1 Tax=Novacetimonas hansenii TaxID=436 RepID=UPI00248EAD2F|nr:cytochrome c [Novacetimonas hansenii]
MLTFPDMFRVAKGMVLFCAGAFLLSACSGKHEGAARYRTNCGICHHNGEGMKGEIPPLIGRVDVIGATAEGRHYLADVLLNGLNGPLDIRGVHYNFSMPSFRNRLSDHEIASILTYLAARGDSERPPVFSADEIATVRAHPLPTSAVAEERRRLDEIHRLP